MKSVRIIATFLSVLVLCAVTSRANAALYVPGLPGNFVLASSRGADASYNAATEFFSVSGSIGLIQDSPPIGGQLVPISPSSWGPAIANDLAGTFSLTALITNSGVVLGGSFWLIGDSATLGIMTPTTLISGNIIDVACSPGCEQTTGFVQFSTDDLFINPALEAVTGQEASALINVDGVGAVGGFTGSFDMPTALATPEIFLLPPTPVPEPATGSLFVVGGLAIIALERRHRRGPQAAFRSHRS